MRLRVYLPAVDVQGTTTIRTLPRADGEHAGGDSVAREAVAQIVKAAVLSLGREPTAATEPSPALVHGGAIISKQPVAPNGASPPSGAHSHDGLFVRSHVGYGYIKASQGSASFDHLVPSVGLAVVDQAADRIQPRNPAAPSMATTVRTIPQVRIRSASSSSEVPRYRCWDAVFESSSARSLQS